MKLREVMVRKVFPVGMTDLVDDAARWMAKHNVIASPVMDDDGHLVGTVTASHLELAWLEDDMHPLRTFLAAARRRRPLEVRDVMRTPVASLTPGADIGQAVQIFRDRTVECVLVVDGFAVAGIIRRENLPS